MEEKVGRREKNVVAKDLLDAHASSSEPPVTESLFKFYFSGEERIRARADTVKSCISQYKRPGLS